MIGRSFRSAGTGHRLNLPVTKFYEHATKRYG